MTEFSSLLQQGHAWLFIPSAILLGALHGLEPGHSKTMMAAFIVAIHGTLAQAVLLGLSATLSHTAVVWVVAMAGLYFGRNWNAESTEPYFQVASAVFIVGVAAWMLWRTWRSRRMAHLHGHDHGQHRHHHTGDDEGLVLPDSDDQDPHARAHAEDIRRRFAGRAATTGQIVLFGLTGGLVPCPASITVLLLCLQLKKLALGAALVLCFSVGLALTLVASGALAALGVRHVSKRWNGFGAFARNAPYFSGALIALVGLYVGYQGLLALR
ncbi:MAG: nickel/cobalt efflux transporter RcnA [Burkholderiaceae bacterium]|jgi:ABC-type nickel/cobalt efflux system permease component RcnA|nr:nickel/cobalt efflux transporter RcnA [Burkholderiaceae bacterium]